MTPFFSLVLTPDGNLRLEMDRDEWLYDDAVHFVRSYIADELSKLDIVGRQFDGNTQRLLEGHVRDILAKLLLTGRLEYDPKGRFFTEQECPYCHHGRSFHGPQRCQHEDDTYRDAKCCCGNFRDG